MGRALFGVSGFVTAPSTTFMAWTMAGNDSLTVRNTPVGSMAAILSIWADNQAAGYLRILSNLMHDGVYGITANVVAAEVRPLLPLGAKPRLYSQDQLIVQQTGSATAGDIESGTMLQYYEDYPGSAQRLATWDQVKNRIVSYMYVNNTLALGTAGGYSGSQVITTTTDQWKANRDYCLMGFLCSAQCCTVGWNGPDSSSLRICGPGNAASEQLTANFFVDLSMATGLPTIQVFNAANKAATFIDGMQDEVGTDVIVTSIFGLLDGPFV